MDIQTVGNTLQQLGVAGVFAVISYILWKRQGVLEKRLDECMEKRVQEAQDG